MAYANAQNPSCPNCNKGGLAILPVRYAVIPLDIVGTLPESLGNKVTDVKLAHNKYALRTLRQGFLYLLHEKHPRGSHIKWEIYSVSSAGTLWKQNAPTAISPVSDEPTCSRRGHNIPASIIAIENPEKCSKVWVAFSEHAWSEDTLAIYENDAALRDRRMQTFLPATWITKKAYRHGLEATKENVEKVIEYTAVSNCARLAGRGLGDISAPNGTYDAAVLLKQSTRHPVCVRKEQSEALVSAMKKVGEQTKGKFHTPIVLALWDAVGITHELNGFRNDAAGWIAKYGKERELEITAMHAIDGVKNALEAREQQQARAAAGGNHFRWRREMSVTRLTNYDNYNPGNLTGHARQVDLCERWEQDSEVKSPGFFATQREAGVRLPEAAWIKEMARIDAEIAQWRSRKNVAGKTALDVQQERSARWESDAIAEAWPKYQKKINQTEVNVFRENHRSFLTDAAQVVDIRTEDLLSWLDSKHLVNALTEFHPENLSDGVAFEDAVGDMVFGISSSVQGAIKINDWVRESRASEHNLVWRAIAANQTEGIDALNGTLAAAVAHSGTPFTESALNAASDSTKHFAKIADLAKKSLSLHNALRKEGVARVPTGGIEKILMTVGDRFFQPFVKKGIDLLSEKFIQGLLFARAGIGYIRIMDLMLAEARFGLVGRTETLVALSMGHAIGAKDSSKSLKSLRDAWTALTLDADKPKEHADPRRAGGFNEAKELRFAMTATLLQGLFVMKLAHDAEKDRNNKRLQSELLAAQLSFGAGFIDLGATAIKGLSAAKDAALSFQLLKAFGGVLSGAAAWVATANDLAGAKKEDAAENYGIAFLYGSKAALNFTSGSCSALVALSYTSHLMEKLASAFPATQIGRVGSAIPRLASRAVARLVIGRALLMVGGLWFSVGVIAIQLLIWKFSDNELQKWCAQCAFGVDKRNRQNTAESQMKLLEEALKEVM